MVQPGPAKVIPRVFAPESGAALAIEDLVGPYLDAGAPGAVAVLGDMGAGKTVARSHLLARWPDARVLDEPEAEEVELQAAHATVVYFAMEPLEVAHLGWFSLAPWTQDEILEYLLAAHREQCGSVMARVSQADLDLTGCPEIWSAVLESMATDESIGDLRDALCAQYSGRMRRAGMAALNCTPHGHLSWRAWSHLGTGRLDERSLSLFRHRLVQILLAAHEIFRRLSARRGCKFLDSAPPKEVIDAAGPLLAQNASALELLAEHAAVPSRQSAAASLLHAAGANWLPPAKAELAGASLAGISWPKVDLTGADLLEADLSRADLTDTTLNGAHAQGINLRRARLHGASLRGLQASDADLRGADLSHVRGCVCFRSADLAGANLRGALLGSTDFAGACLVGADLTRADLTAAKLLDADLAGANLTGACLDHAILKGSRCGK